MSQPDRRYWDSCAFLGWLNDEPDKIDECTSVIRPAERGEVEIVTSAVTLTEVVRLKGAPALPREKEQAIRDFFENDYIIVANLDRWVAERARQLVWEHGLKPKDALHLATALETECPHLDSFDGDLIGLDGNREGILIHIGRPHLPHQEGIFSGDQDE